MSTSDLRVLHFQIIMLTMMKLSLRSWKMSSPKANCDPRTARNMIVQAGPLHIDFHIAAEFTQLLSDMRIDTLLSLN